MKYLVVIAGGWDGGGNVQTGPEEDLRAAIEVVRARPDYAYYLIEGTLLETNDDTLDAGPSGGP